MQHNLVWHLRRVDRISLAPIITDCIRKDAPGTIEIRTTDRTSDFRVAFQSMFCIFVPEMECPVRACRAECAVLRVETYSVDAVYVAYIARIWWGLSVAFETEIGARVFIFDVLDRTAAFDTAYCEASGVREAGHYPCLPFQGRL